MPQRNVATNFTFEQQRVEINELAADFWTQKGTVDTAAGTYLLKDGTNAFTGANLAVPAAFTINSNSGAGTVTIAGNLQVDGTTTTLNTATLEIADKNLVIAKGGANDAAVDGAGITIDSATDITWNFVDADDAWVSSIGVKAVGGFTGNLTGTASGNAVLTGSTNNTICTVTGANAIQGEASLTFDGTSLNLPTVNTWIKGGGHNVLQVDATMTYFYGGSGGAQFRKADNSVPLIQVLDNGNLGIGTDNPSEQLHINSAASTNGLLISSTNNNTRAMMELNGKDSSGNQVELRLGGFGDTNRGEIYTVTNHDIGFATNNAAPQMVLKTSGNVGIGTNNPGQLLEINGASSPCVLLKDTTNNVISYLYADDTNAYVGSASNHPVVIKQNDGAAMSIAIDKQINLGSSGVNQAQFCQAGNNHYIVGQPADNVAALEVYSQHGSSASKISFGVYDNRTGSKSASFMVLGNGTVKPGVDNAQDLGTASVRWANVYTGDMHLNNTGSGGNEIDGSEGHWTMQEGSDDLFLINRNTGKKYKFNLTEVS